MRRHLHADPGGIDSIGAIGWQINAQARRFSAGNK